MQPPTQDRLERAAGEMATAAVRRIESTCAWYPDLPAQERSWVGVLAQAGIASFIDWHRDPTQPLSIAGAVFGLAPRELAGSISLRQTLELVRAVVAEVEGRVPSLVPPEQEPRLREAVLTYSREVAFGVAEVYARAAEVRGAWDARLESLVVDAIVRGEADDDLQSRVAALGWRAVHGVCVIAGRAPERGAAAVEGLRRHTASRELEVLTGIHGQRLIAVIGGVQDPVEDLGGLADHWGGGAVVVGPRVPHLFAAGRSARAALSGLTAVAAWPAAPRPCPADELLPERAVLGERVARRNLVSRVDRGIRGRAAVEQTVVTYLEHGALESTARALIVHPNTVRYRLARFAEGSGYDVTTARDSFAVRLGLALRALPDPPG